MVLTHQLPLRLYQAGVLTVAVLLGLLAAVEPKLALAAAAAMVVVTLVFADLAVGFAVFVFVAFLEALPAFGGVSFPKLVGLLLLLSWLGTLVVRGRVSGDDRSLPPALAATLLLLPAWATVTGLWAIDTASVIDAVQRWSLNLMLIPIAFTAIRRKQHVELMFMVFVAGVVMSVVLGMLGVFGDPSDDVTGEYNRLGGAGINANELGGLLICATTFAAALALTRSRSVAARALWLAIAVLCGIGLVSTLSRGAIVGMTFALACAPFVAGRGRRLPAVALAVVMAGTVALAVAALLPETATQRLTSSDQTGSGRTDIWRVGWRMVEDRPVLGVGAGNFDDTTIRYLVQPGVITRDEFIIDTPKAAHNIYLQVLAELGMVGLAMFLIIIGFALASALGAARIYARARDRQGELLSRALALALIGLAAAEFFSSQLYSKHFWLIMAVCPALMATARREAAS